MSEQDFLSQDEIDALLGDDAEESEDNKSDTAPFDFSQIESIKKGGLPGLEIIYERWVKIFRDKVRKIMPKINMVSKDSVYITRFNTFMGKIPMPSSYTTFSMKPLNESALFVVDSRLAFTILSVLFGGPAKPFKVEGREFTKLEVQIIDGFIDAALNSLEEVWEQFYQIEVEKKSVELNPALARITSGNEKVIIVECNVDIDGYEAPIFYCFPQGMFMAIKDIIYSEFISEENIEWQNRIRKKAISLKSKLILELGKEDFYVKEILGWKEGDEIVLKLDKEKDLFLYVQNIPKYLCKLGKVKDKYAALIKEPIIKEKNG